MAQFRLEIKIHKRGADGSGIMQKAGYNARVALYDDEVGLRTKVPSRSKVEQLAFEKIYLPENASDKFMNRETLWNEVQNVEKAKGVFWIIKIGIGSFGTLRSYTRPENLDQTADTRMP